MHKRRAALLAALLLAAASLILERHLFLGDQSCAYRLRVWWHTRQQLIAAKASLATSHARQQQHLPASCERVDSETHIPRRVFRAFRPADGAQIRTAAATRASWVAAGFAVHDYNDTVAISHWFHTVFPLRREFTAAWAALSGHPVQRVDFFRLAVLHTYGGWWADACAAKLRARTHFRTGTADFRCSKSNLENPAATWT